MPGPDHGVRRGSLRSRGSRRRAFTLIEILIVVTILGILAAITVPQITVATSEVAQTTFASNIRTYAHSEMRYRLETGLFVSDGGSGTLPAELVDYIDATEFERGTPIGGVWDFEFNEMGILSAFGVHFNGTGETRDDAYMNVIDAIVDDGDVTTGTFRRIAADRYYWVVAE